MYIKITDVNKTIKKAPILRISIWNSQVERYMD